MSENSSHYFRWDRRVEFCETDAAGIVHFSSFFLYMEQAEHALFRALGTTIFPHDFHDTQPETPAVTWPRVKCECEYFAPARFEDVLQVDVQIERLGTKSIAYLHRISRGQEPIARGRVVAVCSMRDPSTGRLVGVAIPDTFRESLRRFLPVDGDESHS